MFLMKREADLNLVRLGKIISTFQTRELPKLQKYYKYYKGRQNILNKPVVEGKPSNKIVANYCAGIVQNYTGYLAGKDITYNSDKAGFDAILDCLNYNDVHSVDSELLENACIFGKSAEIQWIDKDGKVRFKPLDPREVIDIYDDTLDQDLLYAVRFYVEDFVEDLSETYIVEVYDEKLIRTYRSNAGFSSFELISEQPHFFGQVPITFFKLNKEEDSIFDKVLSLQDAYNTLISSSIDDYEAFCDAYLVLKGGILNAEELEQMKEYRVLMLDSDQDAEYLTKSVKDTQIENLITQINDQIHLISMSPDFNDERFMSSSGIAMRFKLIGFENCAGQIESQMRKALQRRIELICAILAIKGEVALWRDVNIVFTRNLPVNNEESANMVNQLRGLVSDETLLAQLPFITDPSAEYEKLQKQKEEAMAMYSFGAPNEATDEEEDDE